MRKRIARLLGLGHVDSRVRDVASLLDGDSGSEPTSVLVEDDVLVIFDELDVSSDPPSRNKARLTRHSR